MATAVNDIVNEVEEILSDTSNDRWSAAELITYLNSAQRAIAVRAVALGLRPAYATTTAVKLAAGPVQDAPTGALAILDIHRNMGREWVTATKYDVNDAVYESSTRYVCLVAHTAGTFADDLSAAYWETSPLQSSNIEQINEFNLDDLVPNWRGASADSKSAVYNWIPFTNDRLKFYVYPPQPNSTSLQYVEMTYAALPTSGTAGGNITLADIYKEAIMDYMLYKAYLKEDDQSEGVSRAVGYKNAFDKNEVFALK